MKVLDSDVDEGGCWFRLELSRSTDILAKDLYTENDLMEARKQAIKDYLSWQFENYIDKLKANV